MSDKEGISTQVLFASGAGRDALEASWQEATELVHSCNLGMDEVRHVIFGLKKWMFLRGSHRAVIVETGFEKPEVKNGLKLAFRLELEIDVCTEGQQYITGTFICPKIDCTYKTDSFRKYASHYYIHYDKGDHLTHICCGEHFQDFPIYCKHTYEKHQNMKKIGLRFQRITPDKIDEFLDKTTVTYFPSGCKPTSFRNLISSALSILNNFGTYFVFLWNCQDFASWYLNYNGIPLNEIEPTMPDIFTGSGTDSSARAVQQIKGWWWYRSKENLKTIDLEEYGGEAMCNHPNCKYLPAMTIEDLVLHKRVAHEMGHNQVVEFCVKVLGPPLHFSEITSLNLRKFSIYRLRGSRLNSHEAVVLQPWTTEESVQRNDSDYKTHKFELPDNQGVRIKGVALQSWTMEESAKPKDHYCKIHVIELPNKQGAKMMLDRLEDKDKERMEHVMDVTITLLELQVLINGMNSSVSKISYVTTNCVTFAERLLLHIKENSVSATDASPLSWPVWIRLSLISCTKLYDGTTTLLPLFILIARTCEDMNQLLSLFLFLHIGIHILYNDYSMRDALFDISTQLKKSKITEIKPFHFSLCYIGLGCLGFQGIMDPANISAPLILYTSWVILNNTIKAFYMRFHCGEGTYLTRETVWSSVQHVIYFNAQLYLMWLLMVVFVTLDYNNYIIGQLITIAFASLPIVFFIEHNAITSKKITELEYTLSYRYTDFVRFEGISSTLIQKMIFLLYIAITFWGLFYGKKICSFDGYSFSHALPYLCYFSWKLYMVNLDAMKTLGRTRIGELVPLVTTILKNGNKDMDLKSIFDYIDSVKVALKIFVFISKLRLILHVVWFVIFLTYPGMQLVHIWTVVFINFYCFACTCLVHITLNAANHLYIDMPENSQYLIRLWFKGEADRRAMWKQLTGENEVTLVPFL